MTTAMTADYQRADHAVTKADGQIVKNGTYFHKASVTLLKKNLHHNQTKMAGIFFIYACFNQFLYIQEES